MLRQRGFHAKERSSRIELRASHQALVAVA
jgi:hypothetical protein